MSFTCDKDSDNIWTSSNTIWFSSIGVDMKNEDIEKLIELEWFQEGAIDLYELEGAVDFKLKHYNPDEDWTFYV